MSDERLAFIDRAAAIRGVTRTEFVLRSSGAAAVETLNERPIIVLDDEAWDAIIVQALDERAKSFYARFGFRAFSEREPLMLLLRISEPRALLQT